MDGIIRVWDINRRELEVGPLTGHEGSVNAIVPSGQSLFPPLTGHTDDITSVCSFPDGRHFATGSGDGTIRIWISGDDTNWKLRRDNWVVGENGELMMWIPKDLRRHLCWPRNISILNRSFHLKLHFGTE